MAGEDMAQRFDAIDEHYGADYETDRDLHLVEGDLGFGRRFARFLGSTLLVTLIIGLVGALVLHATIIQNESNLDQQRDHIERIAAETEALRSQLAELEAPSRIVRDAQRLGMIEAPSIEYITVPPGELDERTLIIAANQLQVNE